MVSRGDVGCCSRPTLVMGEDQGNLSLMAISVRVNCSPKARLVGVQGGNPGVDLGRVFATGPPKPNRVPEPSPADRNGPRADRQGDFVHPDAVRTLRL